MFDWFGSKKREDAWMKQPRRMPDGTPQPEGERENDRWIFSREFARTGKKNERIYMAAEPKTEKNGENYWDISLYSYDLSDSSGYTNTWSQGRADCPADVIEVLRDFERSRREMDIFAPIECAPPTYHGFANRNGIHFDDKGDIFTVKTEQPLAKDVYMNRKSLDAIFHKAQGKPIESWQDLYEQLVDSWPNEWTVAVPPETMADAFNAEATTPSAEQPKSSARPVTLEDLAQDPAYPEFAHAARIMVKDLQKVPELLFGTQPGKPKTMNFGMTKRWHISFDGEGKVKLAQRLADASMLVALMRAGADAYADIFSGKQPMNPAMLELVGKVGEGCAEIAEKRFGFSPEQAKKVADLLSKGADPFGPALPIEKLFEKFPPASYTPKAPASSNSKKSKKDHSIWNSG